MRPKAAAEEAAKPKDVFDERCKKTVAQEAAASKSSSPAGKGLLALPRAGTAAVPKPVYYETFNETFTDLCTKDLVDKKCKAIATRATAGQLTQHPGKGLSSIPNIGAVASDWRKAISNGAFVDLESRIAGLIRFGD